MLTRPPTGMLFDDLGGLPGQTGLFDGVPYHEVEELMSLAPPHDLEAIVPTEIPDDDPETLAALLAESRRLGTEFGGVPYFAAHKFLAAFHELLATVGAEFRPTLERAFLGAEERARGEKRRRQAGAV